MTYKHFVFLLLVLPFDIQAQDSSIDSLLNELDKREVYDTEYVDLVNSLSFKYLQSDPLKAPYYINLSISISKDLDYTEGLIRSTTNKGNSYWVIGLLDEALSYYLLSLSYSAEKYPMEYARLNNNIGEVFKKKLLYDSSLKYYRNALSMIRAKIPDQNLNMVFYNIGETLLRQNKIDSAKIYFEKCLQKSQEDNNQRTIAYSYYGLAEIAHFSFDLSKAKKLQKKSLDIRLKINDTRGVITSYTQLGTYEIHTGNSSSSFFYWNKAEKLAVSFRALDLLNEIYLAKSNYYYLTKEYKEAAEYIGAYSMLRDSIKSEEFASSLERTKTALLLEISDAENQLLKEQQKQAEEKNKIVTFYALGILALIMAFFLIVRFYRNRKSTHKKSIREGIINDSLLSFSKEVNLSQSDYDDFIRDFLIASREVLKSDRASYWYLNDEKDKLLNYLLADKNGYSNPKYIISKKSSPRFFKDLMSNRTFVVSDLKNDPRCIDIDPTTVINSNLTSFLASPLYLNEQYVGLIVYSMIDKKREWSFSDQRYVGSLADIIVSALANNQKKLLENEKEQLIHKLTQKNKSLNEFNSVVSHNLREPLTQVIGFSNLLSQHSVLSNSESEEIISRLSDSSQRIDSVIKDLSTLLNEHDLVQEDLRSVCLEKVIQEVLDNFSNEIQKIKPKVDLEIEIITFNSYKPFIFDIIYHLISNSLKFKKPKTPLEIRIAAVEDEEHYQLVFEDNGLGIDLHTFKDRMFKMYKRQHQDIEGRGIGLYLVKNRVESLNGIVEVESEVMKGTTFTIRLPKKGIN